MGLPASYICQPVAIETLDQLNPFDSMKLAGVNHLLVVTGVNQSSFQRLFINSQPFNLIAFNGTSSSSPEAED